MAFGMVFVAKQSRIIENGTHTNECHRFEKRHFACASLGLCIGSITGSRILARWGSKLHQTEQITHGLSYFKESFQLPRNQKLERFEISAFCSEKSRIHYLVHFVDPPVHYHPLQVKSSHLPR